MDKELVIDSQPSEVNIALLEDNSLVELQKEKNNNNYAVGDIYLGRVKKIMPGLNAAFVDVGYERDAFLHYLDLGPQVRSLIKFSNMTRSNKGPKPSMDHFNFEPDIEKTGKITQVLKSNQQVVVQIAKEPISTKGPRISSELSFAGRFLVLVPFSNRISISQKIKSSEERKRLKRLILSIKPKNFGVIIRTVAENKMVAELDTDLRNLTEKWNTLIKKLASAKAPQKVVSELDRTSALLRDILTESFNSINVNDQVLAEEIKHYIGTIAPKKVEIVKLYKGKKPIFEKFGVDKQIKSSFGKTVTIKSGVYLIIEHTEALHVIDVNSGHRVNKEISQEQNALAVNVEAAAEIARQLRLRDMGGIIVIDFIDMNEGKNRRALFQKLKEEMAKDRAKHTILPPSKFGLVQITRQRVRPEMNLEVLEKCPTCGGTGKIRPSIIITDEIENNLRYLLHDQNEKKLELALHPYLEAYLKKGIPSIRDKWYMKYKKWIKLKPMNSYHFLEYRFFNKNKEEIKM
ncbi:MAG: Rne/Rng family ribonuclease [Bacteroidales bacterium]|nr:Rne/Rng family ribonuclease [Bacteroidales bacterium]MCF8386715.1 Rne/Rng family ribonuclease [Bacteroidales bacterium]MCF8397212.1 Rne/Rng family ribonuclease [Bacteroidales bacterium]